MTKRGFTLVELMIVVSILGIMAALVLPHVQNHQLQAREAAAKDNLRIMRTQIELYKLQHNGLSPGYMISPINPNTRFSVPATTLALQLTGTTSITGQVGPTRTPSESYPFGPYLSNIPENPFNRGTLIEYVTGEFTVVHRDQDQEQVGWLFKRETAEIRLNTDGTDKNGVAYINY